MKQTYTNRQLNKFTFEVNERGNIQWSGDFKFHRYGYSEDDVYITMVDPSGGPYICESMDMRFLGFEGMIVERFITNEQGYEIVVKK
jgi:hypothetical protein